MRKKILLFILFTYSFGLFSQLQIKNFFSITGKKDISVYSIAQDTRGYLWIGTAEGLFKFDGKNAVNLSKEFRDLKTEVTAVYIDKKQVVWVGTKTGKVFFIKKNN